MAHSQEKWDLAKILFEVGEPLSEIVIQTGISKGQISKKSKKDNWQKETMKHLVDDEVSIIIKGNEIRKQKETFSDEKRKHYETLLYTELQSKNLALNTAHELIQKISDDIKNGKKLEKVGRGIMGQELVEVKHGSSDHVNHAKALQTVTDTLGITQRHSNSQVTVNTQTNVQQNNIELTEDQAKEKALALGVPLSVLE